jgi:ABC-type sulfate transport system permease subunit
MQIVAAILIAVNVFCGLIDCFVGMRKPYRTKAIATGLLHIALAVALVVAYV